MKKTQKLIFAVVTMVLSLFLLTACGLQTHMHDYSEWGYNDENHWMYCKDDNVKNDDTIAAHAFTEKATDENYHWMCCPTCGLVQNSSKGSHVDADLDGKCDECDYKVPVYVSFAGQVSLVKGGSAPVATNEGVELTVTDEYGEAVLKDYAFNEDGTFSFTAEEGLYTLTAKKAGYVTAENYIELSHEDPVTDYELALQYNLLRVAPKPSYDASMHDFSHQNDEKPYVLHTSVTSGKTLDFVTVDSLNNAMFTYYAKSGQSRHEQGKVGVTVQFYDDAGTCYYLWFTVKSSNNTFEWQKGDMWSMKGLNTTTWGFINGTRSTAMTEEEIEMFENGTLKISVGRLGNMVFAFINDVLVDTVIVDEKFENMNAYMGMLAWDPYEENGQNKFYFDITEGVDELITLDKHNVTVPTAEHATVTANRTVCYEGQKVIYTITPDEGYMLTSVKVNGAEMLDTMVDNALTLDNYTEDTTIEITTTEEVLATINITANAVYNGCEITFVKNGVTQTVTIQDGTASFEGLTGFWAATIKYNGATYDFGRHYVEVDGSLVIDETAKISSYCNESNITYLNSASHKAVATYSPVSGEGTFTMTKGDMMRHTLKETYSGNVAITMYMDPSMRKYNNGSARYEEYGPMLSFDGDFFWFGYYNTSLTWLTNAWHDSDGGNHSSNITNKANKTLFGALNAADEELYQQGKLPLTLVRSQENVYIFVNGRYIGIAKLDAKYKDQAVSVGLSGLGLIDGASFNYKVETDVKKYLDLCEGESNFTVTITGEGLEWLETTGVKDSYMMNETVKLTFAPKKHENAPTNSYVITSFKVNGEEADYTKAIEFVLYDTNEESLEIEVVVELVGPIDVTVTANAFYNGLEFTFTQGEEVRTATFANGKVDFVGLQGIWNAKFQYQGYTFDLGNITVDKDGKAQIADTATTNNIVYDNLTYQQNHTFNKAISQFSFVTGKGTVTIDKDGNTLRHSTLTSYDQVAMTVYLDDAVFGVEEAGAIMVFTDSSKTEYKWEYVWAGIHGKTTNIQWHTNNWHDLYDGKSAKTALNVTGSCSPLMKASLTQADNALYAEGKLPFTLVRDGRMIYAFLNGRYVGYAQVAEKYATAKVQPGVSVLNCTKGASLDFLIETNIKKYLDVCAGESNFKVIVEGEGSENLLISGYKETYMMNEKVNLTFSIKSHTDPNKRYALKSLKVNGETADLTKVVTLDILDKNTPNVTIEAVLEEVSEQGAFSGKVNFVKQGTTTVAKKDFTLKLMSGNDQITLSDYNVAEDGTVTFTAFAGTYDLVVEANGYLTYRQEITLSKNEPITGYEANVQYNLLKAAPTPNYDAGLHDFSHQNETNAYVQHSGTVSGKTLDFVTVDAVDNVIFSHWLKKGQSANAGGNVGILVQFYETNGQCHYLWLYAKSNDYKFEWYNNDLWTMYGINRSGWGFQNAARSANMTEDEKAQYEAGTLKMSVARAGNMIYAFINDELADTIILNDRYATMDCYIGMCAFDPCDPSGKNKFYFELKDFNPTQVTANVSVPAAYEGKELVFVTNTQETATVASGKASFKAMPGLCKAYLRYQGNDYYLTTITIAADGDAEIPEGTVPQYFDPENMTYPAKHKASSTIDFATGEGTITALDTFLRHRSTVEYDDVAFTAYLNYNNLNANKEECGLMMVFENTYYMWYGISKGTTDKLAWHGNNWHDSDGKYFANAINSQLTKTVLSNTLTDAEVAMYKAGTLPMTLVRSGEYVYAFVNGRLTSYAKLPEKYASQKVKVGFSALGLIAESVYNFKVDTDVRNTALNLTVNLTGANSEGLVINGKKDSYAVGELVELTFEVSAGYILKSLTINGLAIDSAATYTTYLYGASEALDIVAEMEKVVTTKLTFVPTEKTVVETAWRDLASGTLVTFTEKTSSLATKVTYSGNKELVVNLQDGTYTVSAVGYASQELIVEDGAVNSLNLQLTRNMLYANGKDTAKYAITEDENGAKAVFTEKTTSGFAIVHGYDGKYVVEATYTGSATWDDGIKTLDANGDNPSYFLNIGDWGGQVYAKWLNNSSYQVAFSQNEINNDGSYTLKLKIVVDGSNIEVSTCALKTNGSYTDWQTKTFTLNFSYLALCACGNASTFTNVTVLPYTA